MLEMITCCHVKYSHILRASTSSTLIRSLVNLGNVCCFEFEGGGWAEGESLKLKVNTPCKSTNPGGPEG